MGKGMTHYTEDGLYEGETHKMDGEVHTGAKHSKTSKVLSHKRKGPFKMKTPLYFKGANSKNSGCWDGYKKVGTKPSPSGTGETVNDCKEI